MKKLAFLLMFGLVAQLGIAQDNSSKSLVKTLDPQGSSSIVFSIDKSKLKEVKPSIWDGGTLQVEIQIKANMPEQVLDQLLKAGRYTLEATKNADGQYVVTAPNVDKAVAVRGKNLEEEIYVSVKTPGNFKLAANGNTLEKEVDPTLVAARSNDPAAAKAAMKTMKEFKADEQFQVKVRFISTLKAQPTNFELKTGDITIDGQALEIK